MKITAYILPRQVGKTTRILEQFVVEGNRTWEKRPVIITRNQESAMYLEKRIVDHFNSLTSKEIDDKKNGYILNPSSFESQTLGRPDTWGISTLFIDEYAFFKEKDKIQIWRTIKNLGERGPDEIVIYTSLGSYLYLKNPFERKKIHESRPHDFLYYPETAVCAFGIDFYLPKSDESEKHIHHLRNIHSVESFKFEYTPDKAIL